MTSCPTNEAAVIVGDPESTANKAEAITDGPVADAENSPCNSEYSSDLRSAGSMNRDKKGPQRREQNWSGVDLLWGVPGT